jgi:hypothetical protein
MKVPFFLVTRLLSLRVYRHIVVHNFVYIQMVILGSKVARISAGGTIA